MPRPGEHRADHRFAMPPAILNRRHVLALTPERRVALGCCPICGIHRRSRVHRQGCPMWAVAEAA